MQNAFNYIRDHKLATESSYPYKGRDNRCTRKDSGERYKVSQYQTLGRSNARVDKLSQLLTKGPVSVALEVRRDF